MNAAVEKDETFNKNCDRYKKLLEKHSEMLTIAHAGGGEKAMLRHKKQNKMLVMDRIKALLDDDSEFFEVATLGGLGMEYGNVPRASIIGGIHFTENCLLISSQTLSLLVQSQCSMRHRKCEASLCLCRGMIFPAELESKINIVITPTEIFFRGGDNVQHYQHSTLLLLIEKYFKQM